MNYQVSVSLNGFTRVDIGGSHWGGLFIIFDENLKVVDSNIVKDSRPWNLVYSDALLAAKKAKL